ncbi:histone methylation protein DOT1-domain-containing protein [Chytriomyces sp. MP71]|nr:histone methylation protein DOT1-domain-containing protein [Chytriomyces sp. MP71]
MPVEHVRRKRGTDNERMPSRCIYLRVVKREPSSGEGGPSGSRGGGGGSGGNGSGAKPPPSSSSGNGVSSSGQYARASATTNGANGANSANSGSRAKTSTANTDVATTTNATDTNTTKTGTSKAVGADTHPNNKKNSAPMLAYVNNADAAITHATATVAADAKIYRHLSSVSPERDSRDNLHTLVDKASDSPRSDYSCASNSTNPEPFETVRLIYPSPALSSPVEELYPLCIPHRQNEYSPIHDIKATAIVITNFCASPQERYSLAVPFGDEVAGPLRMVIRACNRRDGPGLKGAIAKFNECIESLRSFRQARSYSIDITSPAHQDLIFHILDQTYAHTVSPKVDLLKSYKTFSNNVYGEVTHNFVADMLARVASSLPGGTGLGLQHTFLDMGSGTGNVVLQVAAQTLARSYGIEQMPNPSQLAGRQAFEFDARCKAYGIPCGRVHVWQGDFLEDDECLAVLKEADLVFCNNFVFDAGLNLRILERFLDLKDGAVVVTLKAFGGGNSLVGSNEHALEKMFKVKECLFAENGVSWTAEGGKYYINTLRR